MKTFILKFWFVACAIFCMYSLNTVIEERYEVKILAGESSKTDPIILLACQELSSFWHLNKTKIRLNELRDELANHFNRLNFRIISIKEKVLNRLETGQYVIFKDLLCIILNEKRERPAMRRILSSPKFFAFKRSTLDFSQMASWSDDFDQLTVQMRGPPYSNCSETNRRFRCLNECFKNNFKLTRYFYESNETGPIHLDPIMNETTEESERSCFEKCWRENCEIVQFNSFSKKREPKTTALEAEPKLSEFEFWV